MKTTARLLITGLALLSSSGVLFGHHSFSSEYDGTKAFRIAGVVSRIEWANPHVRLYVEVKEANGKLTTWSVELASPSALARNGWNSRTLKVGDAVVVDGYLGKAVATRGAARSVVVADGRSLFVGPVGDSTAARQ